MYYSDFGGPQDKMWKAGETIFPGLDFLRAHASLSSLPLTANGLDPASALALNLHSRGGVAGGEHHSSAHLSPTKGSSPPPPSRGSTAGGPPSPRPGSANTTGPPPPGPPPPPPHHLLSSGLNALNLIHQQQQLHHHHHHSLLHGMTSSSSGSGPNPTTPPSASSTPGGSSSGKPPHHPPTPLHHLSKPSSYSSPPPLACNPEHNVCKLIEYRGAQVAAFMVDGRELICLPQAFELFLKHLVGGLHTVYTKLKRLEITPIVCNVEQVRILRGLGAIQPGVNRCKLISCSEFDTLYEDCTNSNARPGRPPKRVHCSNPVDTDVLEKLKRRKLDIPGDYPYDQRFYDRKPLMNGFPHVGYPPMSQFSNFFGMHHLMQPMAMASHIGGLRPHHHQQQQQQPQQQQQQLEASSERGKLERSNSDSGLPSPKPREDRHPLLGMYGTRSELESRTSHRPSDGEANKPLNLQVNGHRSEHKGHGSDSLGSRTDEEEEEDEAEVDDDKISDDDMRHDEDLDESYTSSEEFHSGEPGGGTGDKPRPGHNGHPYPPTSPGSGHQPQMFVDFEDFVIKFNVIVRALVDAAKAVEKKAGEEKDQISVQLVREKERRQELERAMQQEKKKRAFFQRRFRRLKKDIQGSVESVTSELGKDQEKPGLAESSPEPVVRNAQEAGQHDSDSEKTNLNISAHSEPERERKSGHVITETSSSSERPPARRESYDPYSSSRGSPPASHHTSSGTRHTPPATSPIKFPFQQIVSPAQDV